MPRLPIPGNDTDNWGDLLNEFLNVSHRPDGNLKNGIEVINVKDHAAGGGNDDTDAIWSAIEEAAKTPNAVLYFPPAKGYVITSTIIVPTGISMRMEAPIVFYGDDTSPALVIGEAGVPNFTVQHKLNVVKSTNSDWSDERSIGIQIINANTCHIDIVQAYGFTIGVQCLGAGGGFAHNQIRLGNLINNKIALDLTNQSAAGSIGWCNENVFINGRFSCWLGTSVSGKSRYGVRITSMDEEPVYNNNNLFIKPSFELVRQTAEPAGEALPVLIEYGGLNAFKECRSEGNSSYFARVLNKSTENEFDVGVGVYETRIDEQGFHPSSWATSRRTRLLQPGGSAIFLSGPLHKRAGSYSNEDQSVHIPGVHLTHLYSPEIFAATNGITIHEDYLEVIYHRGVGIFVNTERVKRFVVKYNVAPGFGGRVRIRCYDNNGDILDGSSIDPPYVAGHINRTYEFKPTEFGGVYSTGYEYDGYDFYFRVHEAVKYIDVFLTGTDIGLRLRSFGIYALDIGMASTWTGYEECVPGANIAMQAPTAGSWEKGRIFYNAAPDVGQPSGWVCTESGSPGVWRQLGVIT